MSLGEIRTEYASDAGASVAHEMDHPPVLSRLGISKHKFGIFDTCSLLGLCGLCSLFDDSAVSIVIIVMIEAFSSDGS